MTLYPDTNLIPWMNFAVACARRRLLFAIIYFLLVVVLAYFSRVVMASFFPEFSLLRPMVTVIASAIVFALYCDATMTRPAVVYRKDSSGEVFQDHQKWWLEDAMEWPDAFKLEHGGKRVLWIDGIDPDNPKPFRPWLADPPTAEKTPDGKTLIPVTGTRVASVTAKMMSVGKIMKFREAAPGEKLQQGLMVAALGIGVLAMIMAINRAGVILGFGA